MINQPPKKLHKKDGSAWWPILLAVIFAGTASLSAVFFLHHTAILASYIIMSTIAFIAYGIDKSAAKHEKSRIPENTLHLWSLLGGWPGALVAQKVFRHKTQKRPFLTIYWVTVVINLVFLAWLYSPYGISLIKQMV